MIKPATIVIERDRIMKMIDILENTLKNLDHNHTLDNATKKYPERAKKELDEMKTISIEDRKSIEELIEYVRVSVLAEDIMKDLQDWNLESQNLKVNNDNERLENEKKMVFEKVNKIKKSLSIDVGAKKIRLSSGKSTNILKSAYIVWMFTNIVFLLMGLTGNPELRTYDKHLFWPFYSKYELEEYPYGNGGLVTTYDISEFFTYVGGPIVLYLIFKIITTDKTNLQ